MEKLAGAEETTLQQVKAIDSMLDALLRAKTNLELALVDIIPSADCERNLHTIIVAMLQKLSAPERAVLLPHENCRNAACAIPATARTLLREAHYQSGDKMSQMQALMNAIAVRCCTRATAENQALAHALSSIVTLRGVISDALSIVQCGWHEVFQYLLKKYKVVLPTAGCLSRLATKMETNCDEFHKMESFSFELRRIGSPLARHLEGTIMNIQKLVFDLSRTGCPSDRNMTPGHIQAVKQFKEAVGAIESRLVATIAKAMIAEKVYLDKPADSGSTRTSGEETPSSEVRSTHVFDGNKEEESIEEDEEDDSEAEEDHEPCCRMCNFR